MPEAQTHQADLFGRTVEYEVHRREGVTEPRIDVDIRGVAVILPPDSGEDPEELLAANAAWVIKQKDKYDSYQKQAPERRFEEGAMFPYLWDPYEVIIEQRPASEVGDQRFHLARHHVEQTSIKRALEALYRRKARERFETRADQYAERMGVEYETIEVRNQRTKWGSCSATGTLGLNWRLMMAPPDVSDYVVVHELAHLRELNHTDAFWEIVGQHIPEYQQHITWLSEHSAELIFTEADL